MVYSLHSLAHPRRLLVWYTYHPDHGSLYVYVYMYVLTVVEWYIPCGMESPRQTTLRRRRLLLPRLLSSIFILVLSSHSSRTASFSSQLIYSLLSFSFTLRDIVCANIAREERIVTMARSI